MYGPAGIFASNAASPQPCYTGVRNEKHNRVAFEPDTAPSLTIPAARPGPGRAKGAWRLVSILAGYVIAVALTFLGLLAITFFIGRVIPIASVRQESEAPS